MMKKRTISFSVTAEEYADICENAIEKGLDRPSTLAKMATMQYMSRYPIRGRISKKNAPAGQECTDGADNAGGRDI